MTQPILAEYGTIYLDGDPYPVAGQVTYVDLFQFAPKVTIGDFTRDSDALQSAWIITDLSGGGQVLIVNTASDLQRFWFGTAWTRDPFLFTLNREVVETVAPNGGTCYPLGDLNSVFYTAFGSEVRGWDEPTQTLTTPTQHTLTAAPVNKAANFAGKLYIPQGSGYQTFDGGTIATQVTTANALPFLVIAFCVWDNKLYAFGSDGLLASSADGSTWNTTLGLAASVIKLDPGQKPKNLVAYYDRIRNPALYLVSDRQVWIYDPSVPRIYPTNLVLPPHPDNAKGVAVWQSGGDIYLSAGLNVYRFDATTISEMGPARDNGLPGQYRGQIVDLCAEHNALYALVQGTTSIQAVTDTAVLDETSIYDTALYAAPTVSNSSLMFWTGQGWHTAWVSATPAGNPTWSLVSGAASAYRVFWGYGASLFTTVLPRDFHDPRVGLEAGVDRFAATSYIETGWFDAAMNGFDKLASDVQVNLTAGSATEYVELSYMTDFDTGWTLLGRAQTVGRTTFGFGWDAGHTFAGGLRFNRIRFRWDLARNPANPLVSPLMDSTVFHYIKEPTAGSSWVAQIPLDFGAESWDLRSPLEIKQAIAGLLRKQGFVTFDHGPEGISRRVRVAQARGADASGQDQRGVRTINLVEVPIVSGAL